jgi:hypothetical protein
MQMLEQYVELIRQFVSGEISADDFEDRYIKLWYLALDDFLGHRSPESKVISDLFLEVDAYSNDPDELGSQYSTTAEELRESARKALSELLELQTESHL